jgi:hypothetical protein
MGQRRKSGNKIGSSTFKYEVITIGKGSILEDPVGQQLFGKL